MAQLWSNAAGAIVRYHRDDAEDALQGAPAAFASALTFDEASNAALAADLSRSTDAYRLSGAALTKSGVTQTVAADAPATADRKQVKANLAALFAALRAGTATNAQIQRVLAFLLRQSLQG